MENIALIESFSEFKDDKFIDRVTLMAILEVKHLVCLLVQIPLIYLVIGRKEILFLKTLPLASTLRVVMDFRFVLRLIL